MTIATESATSRRDALGERLFASLLGGMELLAVQLGIRLGLYTALRDNGATTAGALAVTAGIDQRYAQEWLEQHAVTGILEVAVECDDPAERAYALPTGHAEALLDPDSPGYAAAMAPGLVGLAKTLDAVAAAYRTGAGVAYERYGAEVRDCIAGLNRPMFANDLAKEWLACLPDLQARLLAGTPARVLDVACGTGCRHGRAATPANQPSPPAHRAYWPVHRYEAGCRGHPASPARHADRSRRGG